MQPEEIKELCSSINMKCLGNETFELRVERDVKRPIDGRLFLQVVYKSPCIKTGEVKEWHGRKFYLSDYMTADEIVKTSWLAFKLAIEHEIMEGFRVNGKLLFNPHINYEALLAISEQEINREN